MNLLGPHLCAFVREHLPRERGASVHTCDAYAYAFQLLLCFAAQRLKTHPSSLTLEQLDAPLILAFLEHLETERGNCAKTRNARLAAIKTFFRFLEYRVPACLDTARRVHAIPFKKTDEQLVDYLTHDEVQALLDAPSPHTRDGLRDRAMLLLGFSAGLRVSELVGLSTSQVVFSPRPVVEVMGKGRRERVLPLWKETASAIRAWLAVRGEGVCLELFLNAQGGPLTRSVFEYILAKHLRVATKTQASISEKRISPHVLRHTCAMHTLQATGDIRKVALWLGHASVQTTEIYLRADLGDKIDALSALTPPTLRRGRFRPPDKLLEMLRPSKHPPAYAER